MHPRDQITMIIDKIYRSGLTTTSGGNVSIMDESGDMWVTPASIDKGSLRPSDIVAVRSNGTIEGRHRPSSEYPFHKAIYKNRPDIKAIVHAHPTYVSAFTAITKGGKNAINTHLIAESYFILEDPVLVDYRLMGTVDLAEQVAAQSFDHDVLLLENHGAVALGRSMLEAFDKMELLERAAQMTVITKQMGGGEYAVQELPDPRLKQLMQMKYGSK